MHLLLINCSPRLKARSNTKLILDAFSRGYTAQGNTVEIYHLSERQNWDAIRAAFYKNDTILMALPLYVENVPGLMLEFMETLSPKPGAQEFPQTKLAFLLQGGFAEASQLRCGELYLERLPRYLGCEWNGTLVHGDMFVLHMLPIAAQEQKTKQFEEMGRVFAEDGGFQQEKCNAFAGPEYFSKRTIALFTLLDPVKKLFFHVFFKKQGCQTSLRAKPYQKYLK